MKNFVVFLALFAAVVGAMFAVNYAMRAYLTAETYNMIAKIVLFSFIPIVGAALLVPDSKV